MNILNIWSVVCTIFCIYNLNNLANQRYEVDYLATTIPSEKKQTTLVCKELNSFNFDKTDYDLIQLKIDLYNHFKTSNDFGWRERNKMQEFKRLVLDPIVTGSYLIFNGLLCFFTKDDEERFTLKGYLSEPVFFAFEKSTTDFVQMADWNDDKFDHLVVLKKSNPYSDCSKSNSQFGCLNQCFKSRFRLSRYFYDGNEIGLIHLSTFTNRSINESEENCLGKSKREKCKIVQLIPTFKQKHKITTLEANPKLSDFDFWVQFIGFVCSLANVSFNKLVPILIKFVSSKVARRIVRIALVGLKWTILILTIAYCCYLYITMTLDQMAKEKSPTKKEVTRNYIKQKAIRVVIPVEIKKYLTENVFFNLNSLNKTMFEIENATDRALDDYLDGIYLNYQNRMFRVDYTIEPKVLLKQESKLFRLFTLLIWPDYQLMPSSPRLRIKFKVYDRFLNFYLLTENENLKEKTFKYENLFTFKKIIVKRLKSAGNCTDYKRKYGDCTSRSHCIESCINKSVFREFGKVALNKFAIDKDQFSKAEWNTAYPMILQLGNQGYDNITNRCNELIPEEEPCTEIKFEKTVETIQPSDPLAREIDLFLDVELTVEEFSWFNLLLNIMSIHNIFFSLTVLGMLTMIFDFMKPKIRIRNDKIALFLIYLLCSIGFGLHTYQILDMSINSDLTNNLHYEIPKEVYMPVLVFCHQINPTLIDKNYKLTGSYLEVVTRVMTPGRVFQSIAYLSESDEWTSFDLSLAEPFFMLNLKCFRVRISQKYDRRAFHFSPHSQLLKVLKVNFTDTFADPETQSQTVYFMTKTNETTGFSNIGNLDYDYRFNSRFKEKYLADQSELSVRYEDHLSFIKSHLSTNHEDDFNDLDDQEAVLKSNGYGFGTLKNPVERDEFHCELDDDLFDQFFSQVHNLAPPSLLENTNFKKTSLFNYLRTNADESDSVADLTFSLVLPKKIVSVKNEASLILGLLNVLFWFDLGILDLHPFVSYFCVYFLNYFLAWDKSLKKLKFLLFKRIRPVKKFRRKVRPFY